MRLSSISLLCVALALYCCTPAKEGVLPPTDAPDKATPVMARIEPSPAVSNGADLVETLTPGVQGYGPEIFGVRLGMTLEVAVLRLKQGGGGEQPEEIELSGPHPKVHLPTSRLLDPVNLWIPTSGQTLSVGQGNLDPGLGIDACRPSTMTLFHESGIVVGIFFKVHEEQQKNDCYDEFLGFLDDLKRFDFSNSNDYGQEGAHIRVACRYFFEGNFSMRCTVVDDNCEGDVVSSFLLEGYLSSDIAPEVGIKTSKKPSLEYFSDYSRPTAIVVAKLNDPVTFMAEGIDFVNGKAPRFEWYRDDQGVARKEKADATGASAVFIWEKVGDFRVALKGVSLNGKSSIRTIDIRVN